MVGFRVFDVGLLIVWLVWFFRLRDDDDSSEIQHAALRVARRKPARRLWQRGPVPTQKLSCDR